jgi:Trk K+ transport system NAD-binding subunit
MNIILVGAGSTTRALLRRLSARWEVVVVDNDPDRLEQIGVDREITPIVGDGSSRLVLERAGIEGADAVLAATDDDDVNLEVCRAARAADIDRVLAVMNSSDRSSDYRDAGVVSVSPSERAARSLESHLEPRRVSSAPFADGLAEAVELRIAPDASVRGTALRDTHSDTWIVAAILRDGHLIVPHGDTRFEAGDRVTVVGHTRDLSTIIRTFTAGESRFPTSFGQRIAVALGSAADVPTALEAAYLLQASQAAGLTVVHPEASGDPDRSEEISTLLATIQDAVSGVDLHARPVTGALTDALEQLVAEESIGIVCVPAPSGNTLSERMAVVSLIRQYRDLGVALLVSRASHPYASIAVPARRTAAGETAARAGIDIAHDAGLPVIGAAAVSPAFVGREGEAVDARRAATWLREEAAVQGVHAERHVRRGNPVRILAETADESGILVLAMPESKVTYLRPGLAAYVVRAATSSVLLVPRQPSS